MIIGENRYRSEKRWLGSGEAIIGARRHKRKGGGACQRHRRGWQAKAAAAGVAAALNEASRSGNHAEKRKRRMAAITLENINGSSAPRIARHQRSCGENLA